MNRRSFIKTITGFAAGVVAAFVPSKIYSKTFKVRAEDEWNGLGCKDCFVGCGQWIDCEATVRKQLATEYPVGARKELPDGTILRYRTMKIGTIKYEAVQW